MRNILLDPIWANVFMACTILAIIIHRKSIKKLRRDLEDANSQIAELNQRVNKIIKAIR